MHTVSISATLAGLAATQPRGFGSGNTAQIIASAYSQLNQEHQELLKTLREKDRKIEELFANLSDAKVSNAKLEGRLGVVSGAQRLRQFTIFAGTAMLGIAIDLFKANLNSSYLVGAVGLGLLLFGAVQPKTGGGE